MLKVMLGCIWCNNLFYFRSDGIFLDSKETYDTLLDIENLEMFEWKKMNIIPIAEEDMICTPFHGFSIKDWNPDDEDNKQ